MKHSVEAIASEDVWTLDREWEDAIVARDVLVLKRLASDDLVYHHGTGEIDDKAAFIGHINHGPLRFLQVEYEDVRVVIRESAALLTCALHLRIVDEAGEPGELHFRTLHVWAREPVGWQLLANQSSHLPKNHPSRRMPDLQRGNCAR